MTRATGQACHEFTNQLKLGTRTHYMYSFHYHVNHNMRVNLTFLTIDLPTPWFNCVANLPGGISINQKLDSGERVDDLNSIGGYYNYVYCGYYSLFNFYVNSTCFYIKFLSNLEIRHYFKIHFQYSVIDVDAIYTLRTVDPQEYYRLNHTSQIRPFHSYVTSGLYLTSYIVTVHKINRILLNVSLSKKQFLVFDGPGFRFGGSIPEKNIQITSGYICIIQILNSSLTKSTYSVKFTTVTAPIQKQINSNATSTIIQIPTADCYLVLCVLFVKASNGNHVNLTMLLISNCEEQKYDCSEGGVLTGEETNGNYSESWTLCECHNSSKRQSRNFYSLNSSLYLIYYWYDMSNRMDVSVLLKDTKCQAIHLNPCVFSFTHCNSLKMAQAYLDKMTKFTQLDLKINQYIPLNREYKHLLFQLRNIHCAVIQVSNKKSENELKPTNIVACSHIACSFSLSAQSCPEKISGVKGYLPVANSYSSRNLNTVLNMHNNKHSISLPDINFLEDYTVIDKYHNGFNFISTYNYIEYTVVYSMQRAERWIDILLTRENQPNSSCRPELKLQFQILRGRIKHPNVLHQGVIQYSLADFLVRVVRSKSSNSSISDNDVALNNVVSLFLLKGLSLVYGGKYDPHGKYSFKFRSISNSICNNLIFYRSTFYSYMAYCY